MVKELNKIKQTVKETEKHLELKQREYNDVRMSIGERSQELEGKKKQLKSVQMSLEECDKELKEKKELQNSIEKSILEFAEEFGLNLDSARKAVRECCDELELKQSLLDSFQRSSSELNKKFEEKEKHMNSVENELAERLENLEMKERQFEERVKGIELKEQQFHLIQQSVDKRCKEVESKETELQKAIGIEKDITRHSILSLDVNIDQLEHSRNPRYASSNFQSSSTMNESSLPCLINDHLGQNELTCDEVKEGLELSLNPSKFVFDLIHGSYSQYLKNGITSPDASVMRNMVLLLEQLMNFSPKISPQVKEAAVKLAGSWGKNVRSDTEDSMEVLAFLLFLAAYELGSYFRREEILSLVRTVAEQKQAPKIFHALGFADIVSDFIQNLIERKQHMAAARFSCAFGLLHEFPLEHIFKAHVGKSSIEAKCESIDKAITALRSFVELIVDYKLKSRFVTEDISNHISELEREKAVLLNSLQAPTPMDQPASVPIAQPHTQIPNFWNLPWVQVKSKRPRTDESVNRAGVKNQLASSPVMPPYLHNLNPQDQLQPQDSDRSSIKFLSRAPLVMSNVAGYVGLTLFSSGTNNPAASELNSQMSYIAGRQSSHQ